MEPAPSPTASKMLASVFPRGSARRGSALGIVSAAVILVVTQFLLPGSEGGRSRGTPGGILFSGAVDGLLNGLVAIGIVLIYRSGRFINFAQGALGAAGSIFTYNLAVLNKWPFLLAFAAGLIVSAGLGLVVEVGIIRRFFFAPRLVLTVLTIALVGFLQGATQFVSNLPIFPRVEDRSVEELSGVIQPKLPLSDFEFQVGGLPLSFGFEHLLAIGLSLVALAGLAAFFRYSRPGVSIRAAAENLDRAALLGINVGTLSMIVWTIAGLLAGLGVILNGLVAGQFTLGATPPALLLTALAAAVIGKMHNLPTTVGAAVGVSVLRQALNWSYADHLALLDVALLIVIAVGLIVRRRQMERSEAADTSSWEATKEHRPIPKEMLEVGGIQVWRWVLVSAVAIVVLLFPWIASARQTNLAGYVAIVSIVILSLVVLTGWAGQLSLGQFAFVAVGALIGGALTSRIGISFWIAIFVVPILTAAVAVLIGIPALRIKGLFLAVTTFALAFVARSALFNERYFGWAIPERVDRPTLLLLDFEDERSMYYLALIALVLSLVLVGALRRGRIGRVLIAVRENEANVEAFGVDVVKMRLTAFALSGFLCGFAGILLAHHQRAVAGSSFEPQLSLDIFLFAVVGGVGSVSGALLGTAYFAIRQLVTGNTIAAFIVGNAGLLVILYIAPGGLSQLFFGLRDGILRIVAQRRRMIVPSLFADLDPRSAGLNLIPLSEPVPSSGLAALPHDQRYATASRLHGSGWSRTAVRERSDEAAALAAAGGLDEPEAGSQEAVDTVKRARR